jgi:hypothetical protein
MLGEISLKISQYKKKIDKKVKVHTGVCVCVCVCVCLVLWQMFTVKFNLT